MPPTGNTTVPTPEDPSSSSSAGLASPSRLVPALFLAWHAHQPDRIGEVALFDPSSPGPFFLGREDPGDPARVHFLQLRPGETIDAGALTGRNISHRQFEITVEGDALRVHNTGTCPARADGAEIRRGASVLLRPGAILEVHGNCVLLVGRSPLSLPPPSARLLPLHPFGEADRMGLVGESWRIYQLREDIVFASSAGRHVFIHGPTGSGKELVARGIHDLSPRAGGPYRTANAASFTVELAALELFGSPRGYPNPGTDEREGYFGRAKGGTVVLDEIGEALHAVQAPLLRALDGAYNRLGETISRPTQCVVILITNRPEGVKHDVRHRLGVTVETPALADRREDIPLLVRVLLFRKTGRHVEVDPSLIVGLLRSPLSGSVRELDNILTMSVAASAGQGALRWPARLSMPPPASAAPPAEPSAPAVDDLVEGLRASTEPTRADVRRALDDNGWHLGKTASALGISVDKLYRLRTRYGLLKAE